MRPVKCAQLRTHIDRQSTDGYINMANIAENRHERPTQLHFFEIEFLLLLIVFVRQFKNGSDLPENLRGTLVDLVGVFGLAHSPLDDYIAWRDFRTR